MPDAGTDTTIHTVTLTFRTTDPHRAGGLARTCYGLAEGEAGADPGLSFSVDRDSYTESRLSPLRLSPLRAEELTVPSGD